MSMKKFWEDVEKVIKESDLIVEVIDARLPNLTRNKRAEKTVRDCEKKLIIVANKADLINENAIKNHKESKEPRIFFISTRNRLAVNALRKKIFQMAGSRTGWRKIDIGVIGYPNTGKSAFINAIAGKRKTGVAPKPGRTTGIQWVSIPPDIRMIDTPGVVPFRENDEETKVLMNVLDADRASNPESCAREIFKLFKDNKKSFEKLYGIDTTQKTFEKIVREIGEKRKMLAKGGVVDERRVWIKIINDWQRGKLSLK